MSRGQLRSRADAAVAAVAASTRQMSAPARYTNIDGTA